MPGIHGRVVWIELNEVFKKDLPPMLGEHAKGYPRSILANHLARHVRTCSVGIASPISQVMESSWAKKKNSPRLVYGSKGRD